MSLRDDLLEASTDEAKADVLGAAIVAINTTLAIVSAIPTADPEAGETIWNDGGAPKVASAGG